MSEVSLIEAYENGPKIPGDAVEHKVIFRNTIWCQWEDKVRDRACVAFWRCDSDRPMSNVECYEAASKQGFVLKDGRIECGCHGEDDE